jgi:hypothetical protein
MADGLSGLAGTIRAGEGTTRSMDWGSSASRPFVVVAGLLRQ